jgi:hypothetical protein
MSWTQIVDGMLGGVLPGRGDRDVQADHLGDLAMQGRRRAGADLFGDRQQRMDIDRQRQTVSRTALHAVSKRRHRGLVVEVAGIDVAIGLDLGLRIEGDPVADIDAGASRSGGGRSTGRSTRTSTCSQPIGWVSIFVAEGMAGGLQRQAGAAQMAVCR